VPSTRHTAEATKCGQCSLAFDAGDSGVLIDGERFHARCLLSVITDETIRLSRSLSERSRELIEQSRRRLRRTGYSWMPLDYGLVVEGRRQLPSCGEDAVYHAAGIPQGWFRLELPIPARIDPERVEARYDRGLLHITLPKRA